MKLPFFECERSTRAGQSVGNKETHSLVFHMLPVEKGKYSQSINISSSDEENGVGWLLFENVLNQNDIVQFQKMLHKTDKSRIKDQNCHLFVLY